MKQVFNLKDLTKKLLVSFLVLTLAFVTVVPVSASTVEPRYAIHEVTKTDYVSMYDRSDRKIANVKVEVKATIKELNGKFSIESYKTKSEVLNPTNYCAVVALDGGSTVKGTTITIQWKSCYIDSQGTYERTVPLNYKSYTFI